MVTLTMTMIITNYLSYKNYSPDHQAVKNLYFLSKLFRQTQCIFLTQAFLFSRSSVQLGSAVSINHNVTTMLNVCATIVVSMAPAFQLLNAHETWIVSHEVSTTNVTTLFAFQQNTKFVALMQIVLKTFGIQNAFLIVVHDDTYPAKVLIKNIHGFILFILM